MLAALLLAFGQTLATTPPDQPSGGPGGAEYAHDGVRKTLHPPDPAQDPSHGGFWIFEPAIPPRDEAPVVAFFHGFGASDPSKYGAWIDHLVRRGNIVVYPLFQAGGGLLPDPARDTRRAHDALSAALERLDGGEHARGDTTRLAFAGHSIGGLVAAEVAALAAETPLPSPRVLLAVEPGAPTGAGFARTSRGDLSRIPEGTLLLLLAGDADSIAGDVEARRIYRETTSVPKRDKDLCIMHSDDHGEPPLHAHHLAPLAFDSRFEREAGYGTAAARKELDALDFYGPWKLLDALCAAAFDGEHREYALGNTPEQRYMGVWSDGRPVVELDVFDL